MELNVDLGELVVSAVAPTPVLSDADVSLTVVCGATISDETEGVCGAEGDVLTLLGRSGDGEAEVEVVGVIVDGETGEMEEVVVVVMGDGDRVDMVMVVAMGEVVDIVEGVDVEGVVVVLVEVVSLVVVVDTVDTEGVYTAEGVVVMGGRVEVDREEVEVVVVVVVMGDVVTAGAGLVVPAEGEENEVLVVVKIVGVVMGKRVEVVLDVVAVEVVAVEVVVDVVAVEAVAVEVVEEVEGAEELWLAASEVTAAGVVSALGGVMGCTATAGLMPEPKQ
ncbi:unnamed protein product [Arctogadus glacialis]